MGCCFPSAPASDGGTHEVTVGSVPRSREVVRRPGGGVSRSTRVLLRRPPPRILSDCPGSTITPEFRRCSSCRVARRSSVLTLSRSTEPRGRCCSVFFLHTSRRRRSAVLSFSCWCISLFLTFQDSREAREGPTGPATQPPPRHTCAQASCARASKVARHRH